MVSGLVTSPTSCPLGRFREPHSRILLEKSLLGKPIAQIEIGDVFIRGGSPGHAIIVVDMAVNSVGKKIFLLAQSYIPAQDIHVLKNLENSSLSPWYELPTDNFLQTPEWKFATNELKTW